LSDLSARGVNSLNRELMSSDSVAIAIVKLYRAHHRQQFEVIATNRNRLPVYCHLMRVHVALSVVQAEEFRARADEVGVGAGGHSEQVRVEAGDVGSGLELPGALPVQDDRIALARN
jgi:hypothetical protein